MSKSKVKNESSDVEKSPRTTRKNRTNFSGLDIESDGDDVEYDEAERSKDNIDDDGDFEDKEQKARGTKRKAEDEEPADESDGEIEGEEEEEEEEEVEEEVEEEEEEEVKTEKGTTTIKQKVIRKVPKKRGRKRLEVMFSEEGAFDEDGNPINVVDDEVVMDDEDPKGLEKVDKDGYLVGDREYRNKTFTVLNSGRKLYMISTDPARLVGFRDSYLLFKTHRFLFKKTCTEEEKADLIDRGLIPNSYKGRSVNLVAARSIFREFGAKVLRNGKKVIDDFWEERAIKNGDVPGAYADPLEMLRYGNRNAMVGDPGSNGGSTPVTSTPLISYQTDPTWMFQIAQQTKDFNKKLLNGRLQQASRGIKDLYTNLNFYPAITQPTKTKKTVISDKGTTITNATTFRYPDITKKITGLKSIPKEIYADVDDDIKQAILAQQEFEKSA